MRKLALTYLTHALACPLWLLLSLTKQVLLYSFNFTKCLFSANTFNVLLTFKVLF